MVEKDSTHVKQFPWARLVSQAGSQDLLTCLMSSFAGQRVQRVEKHTRYCRRTLIHWFSISYAEALSRGELLVVLCGLSGRIMFLATRLVGILFFNLLQKYSHAIAFRGP